MKECLQCKKQYEDDFAFCPQCGGKNEVVQDVSSIQEEQVGVGNTVNSKAPIMGMFFAVFVVFMFFVCVKSGRLKSSELLSIVFLMPITIYIYGFIFFVIAKTWKKFSSKNKSFDREEELNIANCSYNDLIKVCWKTLRASWENVNLNHVYSRTPKHIGTLGCLAVYLFICYYCRKSDLAALFVMLGMIIYLIITGFSVLKPMLITLIICSVVAILIPPLGIILALIAIGCIFARLKFIQDNWHPILGGLLFYLCVLIAEIVLAESSSRNFYLQSSSGGAHFLTIPFFVFYLHAVLCWQYANGYTPEKAVGLMAASPLYVLAVVAPFLKVFGSFEGINTGESHAQPMVKTMTTEAPVLSHSGPIHHGTAGHAVAMGGAVSAAPTMTIAGNGHVQPSIKTGFLDANHHLDDVQEHYSEQNEAGGSVMNHEVAKHTQVLEPVASSNSTVGTFQEQNSTNGFGFQQHSIMINGEFAGSYSYDATHGYTLHAKDGEPIVRVVFDMDKGTSSVLDYENNQEIGHIDKDGVIYDGGKQVLGTVMKSQYYDIYLDAHNKGLIVYNKAIHQISDNAGNANISTT